MAGNVTTSTRDAVNPLNPSAELEMGNMGFLSLPLELREMVYDHLFEDGVVNFAEHTGFARSGQFLRTCKTIFQEAVKHLYGKPDFEFDCDKSPLAVQFFEPQPWGKSYTGYAGCHKFLQMTGPTNISSIRYVRLLFDNPTRIIDRTVSKDKRGYANDPHLRGMLGLLGQHSMLVRILLEFNAPQMVTRVPWEFLRILNKIKADWVAGNDWRRPIGGEKESRRVNADTIGAWLEDTMVRKVQLYPEKGPLWPYQRIDTGSTRARIIHRKWNYSHYDPKIHAQRFEETV